MSIKETVLADAVPTSAQSAVELAARLDAARDAAAEALDSVLLAFGQLQQQLATVTRERDEAREAVERLTREVSLAQGVIGRLGDPDALLSLSALLDAARRERDEARAQLATVAARQREACTRSVEELIERRWPDAGDRPSCPPAAVLDALTRVTATPLVTDGEGRS